MDEQSGAAADVARIEALLAIMHEHDLDAIKVKVGETEYELVRRSGTPTVVLPGAVAGAAASVAANGTAAARPEGGGPPANAKRVTAPLVGVFYRAPSPGAEAFVEVGQRVEVGQTLCILEAMKMMNEITSDYAGVVARIIPENGELVSLGEEMFWIEP